MMKTDSLAEAMTGNVARLAGRPRKKWSSAWRKEPTGLDLHMSV
jgi:hypothetical protein